MKKGIVVFVMLCTVGVHYVQSCGSGAPPTAYMLGAEDQVAQNQVPYVFYGSSAAYNGAQVANYHWDFGDEQTCDQSTDTVSHTFSGNPKEVYTVELTVTDNRGRHSEPVYCRVHLREGLPVIWYVSQSGNDAHGGDSWGNAFQTIGTAVAVAQPGDQIWVAASTTPYHPAGTSRTVTFGVNSIDDPCNGFGIAFYGGFTGESSVDGRNIAAHETILSGDLNDDDGQTPPGKSDNCYRVVSFWRPTRIDGFTIKGGQADGGAGHDLGAGYYGKTVVANCTFEDNYAAASGGALYLNGCEAVNCTFRNNTAQNGGGIYTQASPALTDCVFEGNAANADGGAIWVSGGGTLTMTNCTFKLNTADNSRGGGVYASNAALTAINCVFDRNHAVRGAGLLTRDGDNVTLTNCTFSLNETTAEDYPEGSGFRFNPYEGSTATVTNCIFWGNVRQNADSPALDMQLFSSGGNLSVTFSDLQKLLGETLPGTDNMSSDPCFAYADSGDLHLTSSSQCIDAGDPSGNYAGQVDMDGDERVARSHVDMGADEYTRRVGVLGSDCEYSSIQAAINAAVANDVIVVGEGTYNEQINFSGKPITIRSTSPDSSDVVTNTIISGENAPYGVATATFNSGEGPDSVLEGLTLTDGYYGVRLYSASGYCPAPTISKCRIVGNGDGLSAFAGSGVNTVPLVSQCYFANNQSVSLDTTVAMRIQNCVFAQSPTGVYYESYSSSSSIRNCTFVGHTTPQRNGVALIGSVPVTNSIFWNNDRDIAATYNPVVTYSSLRGTRGTSIDTNIDVDPQFMDEVNGDYHLQVYSQCVDAGNPNDPCANEPGTGVKHLDMGAYGNTADAVTRVDADNDGIADAWERQYWPNDDPSLHGPNDDPDGDGLRNIDLYHIGWDPTVNYSGAFEGLVRNSRILYRYPSVTMAMRLALPGDTVVVDPCHFHEQIDFEGKRITVSSTNPDNAGVVKNTIIDAGNKYTATAVMFQSNEQSDSVLEGMTLTNGNKGVCLNSASGYCPVPTISKCRIVGNTYGLDASAGGGVNTVPLVSQCYFGTNQCSVDTTVAMRIQNCVFVQSPTGVYYESYSSSSSIRNCTFVGNTAPQRKGVALAGSVPVTNSIFWNNDQDIADTYNPAVTYSSLRCGSGTNIDVDPLFVDEANGDYHLWYNSPCVDAGNPNDPCSNEPGSGIKRLDMGAYGNTAEAITLQYSNNDSIPDGWKRYYWPNDDPSIHGANDQPYGDGFTNWIKYLFRYDPTVAVVKPVEVRALSISPASMDAFDGGTIGISYAINKMATVTIVFRNYSGTPVRQFSQANVSAGLHEAPPWDGTDINGLAVPCDSFYDVTITAQVSGNPGETATWTSPSVYATSGDLDEWELTTTGVTQKCVTVVTEGSNAYANLPVRINLCVPMLSRYVRCGIHADNASGVIRHLMPTRAMIPGVYTMFWDGLTDGGSVYSSGGYLACPTPSGSPERAGAIAVLWPVPNSIVTSLQCNSYRILPAYNEVSALRYTLAKNAYVTIDIVDPDGSNCRTLASDRYETAGLHGDDPDHEWDGKNNAGQYVYVEGIYRVVITARSPVHSNVTDTRTGLITVYR